MEETFKEECRNLTLHTVKAKADSYTPLLKIYVGYLFCLFMHFSTLLQFFSIST